MIITAGFIFVAIIALLLVGLWFGLKGLWVIIKFLLPIAAAIGTGIIVWHVVWSLF